MVLKKEKVDEVIGKYQQSQGDTGSPEVQVALLTEKINQLVEHLKINKKDNHSRHGLLLMVSQRKKFLNYLQKDNLKRYQNLKTSLGLK
ncbi:MAG: 30S ribosomal protein S15 [bacterium]